MNPVGIFWNYENCRPPSFISGYTVVERIRQIVQPLGSISVFNAYFDVNLEASKGIQLHELQSSGVSLIHTPHSTSKNVADKVLLVDLLVFALEGQGKKTIVIITGDQDFNYAVSTLRMRGHDTFIISLPRDTRRSLSCLANGIFDWRADVLMLIDEPVQKPSLSAQGCSPTSPIRADSSMPPTALASAELVSSVPLHSVTVERTDMQGVANSDTTSRSCTRTRADSTHSDHESMMPEAVPSQNAFSAQAAYADLGDCTPSPCLEQASESQCPTHEDLLNTSQIGLSSLSDTGSEATHVDQDEELAEDTGKHPAEVMSRIHSTLAEVVSEDSPSPSCKTESSHIAPMADLSFPAIEMFSDLVEVLEHEYSLGRLSTACGSLELLLLEANPWVYEVAGFSRLQEYLEAAQRANIVFFTSIDWETKTGYVFLRTQATPSEYAGRLVKESDSLEDSIHPPYSLCSDGVNPSVQTTPAQTKPVPATPAQAKPAQTKPAQAKPTQTKPAQTKPAQAKPTQTKPAQTKPAQAKPTQTKPAQAKPAQTKPVPATPLTQSTHGYIKPIDPNFKVLVDELRALRSKGQVPIERGNLSPMLLKRDSHVYSRSGFSKVKGYISRAADKGVVLLQQGGKKGKVSVSLHPDYY